MVALHRPDTNARPLSAPDRAVDVLAELAAYLPSWFDDAACRGEPTELFFVERGRSTAAARAICRGCPVRDNCLDWAIKCEIDMGIFGGKAPRERKALAALRRRHNAKTRLPV